jgi:hypothetical protein
VRRAAASAARVAPTAPANGRARRRGPAGWAPAGAAPAPPRRRP